MTDEIEPTPSARPSNDRLTPAMRQYVEQKAAAPDALLLFRMGDFYETFFEDAQTAARVLGITLTKRGTDADGAPIPLAGIPYHALESYLTRLVHAGYKVAISEQVEDPKTAKGVVRRELVRIVTPGTLTEDALLENSADNYLACLCRLQGQVGLAYVELSTGAFGVELLNEREIADELARMSPAEILVAEVRIDATDPFAGPLAVLTSNGTNGSGPTITRRPPHLFDPYQAEQKLLSHFGVATLEGFGFAGMDASLCAAAAIIDYLAETQKSSLKHIIGIHRRQQRDYVAIDESTWRSLEVERTIRSGTSAGTLLAAVNRTSTSMGARCLRRWLASPLCELQRIRERQEAVAELLSDVHLLAEVRTHLRLLSDIERITARLGVGRASPRDLVALGVTLIAVEKIVEGLDELARRIAPVIATKRPAGENEPGGAAGLSAFLTQRRDAMCGLHDLAEYLVTALSPEAPMTTNEGGIIAPGFDAELDRLRGIGADGRQWLADYQAREIERSGISSLKVGFNQVFGYYIEITNAHRDRIPADYVRKQTLKNAERYITDELKKYETEVLTARDRANAREAELFEVVRQQAIQRIAALQKLAAAVSEVDVVAGLAHLADERRYVRPELVDEPVLEIADGRHPVLEQTLAEKFVPNDCHLRAGADGATASTGETGDGKSVPTLAILTGPNMAGKSTYIRQVALLTLLAQTGSFVPAASMRLGPVDRLFARVGASDEISRGQSTFMVEMTEAANILHNSTRHSLVIIDELGRGTSTFDGLSLAWAIAEDLVGRLRCRALFATHYHELTQLQQYLAGVGNFNVAVREWQDSIVFLHRIVPGGADKSYGSHVAKLAGVPAHVIQRSRELLAELESNFSADNRAPVRAARRNKERQLYLFGDPAEDVIGEVRDLDLSKLAPTDALNLIQQWRKRLE